MPAGFFYLKGEEGDSLWSIAKQQLQAAGGEASDAAVRQRTMELMQANPGIDLRKLKIDQTINPSTGAAISDTTLNDYNADAQRQAPLAVGPNLDSIMFQRSPAANYQPNGNNATGPSLAGTNTSDGIDHSLQVGHGFVYSAYREGMAASADRSRPMLERGVNYVLASLAAPLAIAEEYIARPIVNAPYEASLTGQYLARADLQTDPSAATLDRLQALQHGTTAFLGFGAVGEGAAANTVATRASGSSAAAVTGKINMRSPNELMGVEPASPELVSAIASKRDVVIARPGTEELRMLDYFGAEASVGGVKNTHILLRENPSKAAVLEEFLHGTQTRLGITDRLGTSGFGSAETHVKDFMIRHQNMLGLGAEDVRILQMLRDKGL